MQQNFVAILCLTRDEVNPAAYVVITTMGPSYTPMSGTNLVIVIAVNKSGECFTLAIGHDQQPVTCFYVDDAAIRDFQLALALLSC